MKLSQLKSLIQEYDQHKGFTRRLFGDAFQIKVLKELINELNLDSDNDPDISLQAYQDFASRKYYDVDLSDQYLASNSASSNIFKQWKQEQEIIIAAVSQIRHRLTSMQIASLSSVISELSLEISSIGLNTSALELSSVHIPSTSEIIMQVEQPSAADIIRQIEQPLLYSRFRQHTFRYATHTARTAPPQYPTSNYEGNDNNDFDFHGPQCAPAA